MSRPRRVLCALSASCLWIATPAGAQDTAASAAQGPKGPMLVERVQSGWVVAPDVKVTSVDRRTSALAGVYGGWLNDRTFFIGGAGYWLANGNRDREMVYGGAVVGLLGRTDRLVGVGAKTLIGFGQATLGTSITEIVLPPPVNPLQRPQPPAQPILTTVDVRQRTGFFVAEPEANLLLNFSRNVRLAGGVGYRFVGADHRFDGGDQSFGHRLRGATASLALQIGGS